MKRLKQVVLLAMLAVPLAGWSKIDLVTLPDRDSTELTIYKEIDLTLVRETRYLSFRKGDNEIQFSWAGVLVDPTSLELDLGQQAGTQMMDAFYPANSEKTIVWNVVSEEAGMVPVEIRYFVSGLSWSAENTIIADEMASTFTLTPEIRISNESGEDFDNAHIRVVVGAPNLIDEIKKLATEWLLPKLEYGVVFFDRIDLDGVESDYAQNDPFGMPDDSFSSPFGAVAPGAMGAPAFGGFGTDRKEVFKKAVSEYQLYSVEGEIDLKTGWIYEIPNPEVADIPFEYNNEVDNNTPTPMLRYKTLNDEDHELGDNSIPGGQYYVYKGNGDGSLSFVCQTHHDYIPIGGEMELELGNDPLLGYEHEVLSVKRSDFEFDSSGNVAQWNVLETIAITLKNTRTVPVSVKLTEHLESRNWEMLKTSHPDYKKLTDSSLRWELELEPSSNTTIEFDVRYKMDSVGGSFRGTNPFDAPRPARRRR